MSQRIAPGPAGFPLLGNLPAFRRDVIELALEASRVYGDVVRFRLGPRIIHLLNHPDHINHVLVHNQKNYQRTAGSASKIALVCGESLLTTSGPAWSRQRSLVQPALHPHCLAGFVPLMTIATAAMLERWQPHAREERPLAIDAEMARLTFTIAAKTLFGAGADDDAEAVAGAMDLLLEDTFRRIGRLIDLPLWVPSPGNRRFRQARDTLDRVVYRVIDERRRHPGETTDVLTRLLRAGDGDAGNALTDEQLRDHTITLLLAGHETTANALSWTFYLLSTHPDVERQLHAELAAVLDGRPPAAADLSRLAYTAMVLNESLRLYPSIWILERHVIDDDEIGGYHIPAGSTVVVCPFTLHRHPSFWPNPDRFDPSRFAGSSAADRPAGAFLPFGAGPHFCIGSHFALVEARIVLAMVAQTYRLRVVAGHRVRPKGGITLRFREGLRMTAHHTARS